MSAESDKVPSTGTPEKPSERDPCHSLARPALDSPAPIPIPAQEEKVEEGEGARAIPAPVPSEDALQEGAGKSPAGGRNESKEAAEAGGQGEGRQGDSEGGGDGYRTPTSPRHRIPSPVMCPPAPTRETAPKRPSPGGRLRAVRRRLQLLEDVVVRPTGPPSPRRVAKGVLLGYRSRANPEV